MNETTQNKTRNVIVHVQRWSQEHDAVVLSFHYRSNDALIALLKLMSSV